MADSRVQQFRERYRTANGKREMTLSLVNDCYEFALPLRQRPYARRNRPDLDRLFDGTAPTSLENYASSTLNSIWPLDQAPFELKPTKAVSGDQRQDWEKKLEDVAESIISAVNNSRFRSVAYEAFLDYGIGTGIMIVDAGDAIEPLRFEAVPLSEAVLSGSPWGGFDGFYRLRCMKVQDVERVYAGARLPDRWADLLQNKPDAEVKLIEGCERDRRRPGEEAWDFLVVTEDTDDEPIASNRWEGVGSCPFIAFSFSRVSGETLGRGPVMRALPDIKVANMLTEMVLEGADISLTPIYLYDDDGTINPDTAIITPGALVPRTPGQKGLEPITPSLNLNDAQNMLLDLRSKIKDALFDTDLGPTDKTPMTATEVMQRTTNRAQRLAGSYGNLLQEFLFPLVRRVWWLMLRHSGIDATMPRLGGDMVEIKPVAPLARAMAQGRVLAATQYLQLMQQLLGPETVMANVADQRAFDWFREEMGVSPDLLMSEAEKKKAAQQIMGAVQNQTGPNSPLAQGAAQPVPGSQGMPQ